MIILHNYSLDLIVVLCLLAFKKSCEFERDRTLMCIDFVLFAFEVQIVSLISTSTCKCNDSSEVWSPYVTANQ